MNEPLQQKNSLKAGAYISFGVFIMMLAGAIYYYRERIFFADASHIAFMAINEQALQIQQYRFGAFITQMVPVMGAKLGLSVNAIMLAYSASFNIFYLFVAAMLLFWFRSYRLLVLYAFYWVLVTSWTFFWPNNEVHQGVAYMFLLIPWLQRAGEKQYPFPVTILLLIVLGATAIFAHPLVIPPFLFLWVYLVAEKKHWHFNKKQTIILSAVLLLIIAAKMFVSKKYSGYDMDLLVNLDNLKPVDIINAFSSTFAQEIYRHVPTNYWILPILILVGIITLLFKRQFFLAVWTLGCTTVYFILLCLTFKGYMEFISESELMAGIIIGTAPFVFVTLASIRREAVVVILLFIFVARYIEFSGTVEHFEKRWRTQAELLGKMSKKHLTKLVLVKEGGPEWTWMNEWSFPTETMMMSGANWMKPSRQIVILQPQNLQRVPQGNSEIIMCFENWPAGKLDFKYFPFDTTQPYTVMDYETFVHGK